MKKYSILFAALAATALLGACSKESVSESQIEEQTVLKASLSDVTKTAIDGVKITWTAGDAINVNGTVSSAIDADTDKATFTFKTALTAPYKAVYPTSIYKDESTVTLPNLISADAFSLPLYGYLESGDEISFKAMTALLKISVTGDPSKTIKDITLRGLAEEQLSGDFSIDFTTGTLTGTSTGDADKVVKINVGKALSADPLVFYIPIPAGSYASGYKVEILDTDAGLMENTVSARTVKAGELREMPTIAYAPNVTPDENIGGIPNATELKDFATAVNEGRDISRWLNTSGEVELLADIDLDGAEWTPIGNASVTKDHAVTGSAFTGVFNGGNHKVDNFTVTIDAGDAATVAGLFGAVTNATVKNLVIGDKVVLKTSATAFVTMGGAVAFASESTLDNIDSYAKLINDGGKDNTRLVIGGAVGTIVSTDAVTSSATNIKGHASFDVVNNVNTKNGATGFIVGGVIGYTNGVSTEHLTLVKDCTNYSSFSAQATRTAGVVGTMNVYSHGENLVNYGNISCSDTKASNSRPSGIVSAMGNYTTLTNCVNYGDIAFTVSGDTTHGYAAGVVGQTNDGGDYVCIIDGCASYGTIQSDRWFASEKFMGILCASFNTKKIHVRNCIIGGKIGPYTPTTEEPIVTITAENFANYISLTAAERIANVTFENNQFGTKE